MKLQVLSGEFDVYWYDYLMLGLILLLGTLIVGLRVSGFA